MDLCFDMCDERLKKDCLKIQHLAYLLIVIKLNAPFPQYFKSHSNLVLSFLLDNLCFYPILLMSMSLELTQRSRKACVQNTNEW